MNKTILLLLLCCFSLSTFAQTVIITGQVTAGTDAEPAPEYPVWGELISANGDVISYTVVTGQDGTYEMVFESDFNGENLDLYVYTFDFCTGEDLSLTYSVSDPNTVIEGADFNVCANIDPPDPEPGCEAYFAWEQTGDNPLTFQFFDLSYNSEPITSWAWEFGDGNTSDEQNPIHTYDESGVYPVLLTISSDSCSSTIILDFDTENTNGCDCPEYYDPVCVVVNGDTLSFDNICFALCENYSPDDIFECGDDPCGCDADYDPVCAVTPDGNIIVFSNACLAECAGFGEDSFMECDGNDEECQALFYVNQEDFNSLTVEFVDISQSNAGDIVSWFWEFGDGNTSDEQNPSHTYDEPGIYDITLTITTSEDCESSIDQHICIGLINDCNCPAEYDPVCVELEEGIVITFPNACEAECAGFGEDAYFVCDGNPDDCVCTDEYDPTCVQLDNGEVIVFGNPCLAECAGYGEDWFVDCDSTDICICPDYFEPVCVISPEGDTLSFPNPCYAECEGYGEDAQFECDFNVECDCPDYFDPVCAVTEDGEIITYPNICIALICENVDPNQIIDCDGDTDPCVCPDIYAPVCVELDNGEVLSFANSCYAECEGYGEDDFVDCDFNNPCDCPFLFDPVCVLIDSTGEFLIFENACIAECEGYGEDTYIDCNDDPWEGCYASFYTEYNSNNILEVSFVDASDSDEGDVAAWEWDFGDGNTSNEQNPTHVYDAEGIYEITLTITTTEGCTATTVQHICLGDGGVFDGPDCQAIFFFEFDEENENTFHFQDLSFGEVLTWDWDFGDGNSSDEQNPSHTYEEAGIYLVTLTVTTEECESSTGMLLISNEDVIYNNECNALFIPLIIPDSNQVFLLNLSSGDAVSFEWDLGDGNTSTEPILVHTYEEPGTYDITLTITTADGCSNSFSVTVDIEGDNFTSNPAYLTVTSTEDIIDDATLKLYPNPVRELLNLEMDVTESGQVQISLIGVDGKVHQSSIEQMATGQQKVILDVNKLPQGVYFVRMQSNKVVKSLKFIKN